MAPGEGEAELGVKVRKMDRARDTGDRRFERKISVARFAGSVVFWQ
jgi:hypothetical protein